MQSQGVTRDHSNREDDSTVSNNFQPPRRDPSQLITCYVVLLRSQWTYIPPREITERVKSTSARD